MYACTEMSFMQNSLYPRHVGRIFGLRLFLTELSSSLSEAGRSEVVSLSRRHPTFTSGRISLLTCFYKFHEASDRQGCLPEGRQTTPLGADSRPDNESGSVRHRAGAWDCVPFAPDDWDYLFFSSHSALWWFPTQIHSSNFEFKEIEKILHLYWSSNSDCLYQKQQ